MNKILCLGLMVIFSIGGTTVSSQDKKPRVVVMTDGEIDDHSSMIRFLLYTCDVDVLAIIETNSMFQKTGHSKEDWYEKQLDAYKEVYSNLIKHNPDYPTFEKLKSISYIGDEDYEHLKDTRDRRWELVPGYKVIFKPDNWTDTPGSEAIVKILLENNPDPVHIQAWGGGNTAARAFYKLKTEYPDQYDRAVSKAIMYNIWYQDGAGNYIEQNHPKVTMIHCASFAGTWNYKSQKNTYDFIKDEIKNNHGPLGGLYPQDYVSEGDSPAFLYSIGNGLRNHENPTFGGWGGRFEKFDKYDNVFVDAKDDGDIKKSLSRWVDVANRDFASRADWCVKPFREANHPPVVKLTNALNLTAKPGNVLKLSAKGTSDPDGDDLSYSWWQYEEADTYKGIVKITDSQKQNISFTIPKDVKSGDTIHIICEVTDHGIPSLARYQRVIISIK